MAPERETQSTNSIESFSSRFFANKSNGSTNNQIFKSFLNTPGTQTSVGGVENFFLYGAAIAHNKYYGLRIGSLVSIDTTFGGIPTLGILSGLVAGHTVTGMAFDKTSGLMYVSSSNGSVGALYTINLSTAALTTVAATMSGMTVPIEIAINKSGVMYSWDVVTNKLYTVDKSTGASTEVGPLGIDISFAQGGGFDPETDSLFLAAYLTGPSSGLYRCNTSTGATTFIGSFGTHSGVTAQVDGFVIPGGNVSVAGAVSGNGIYNNLAAAFTAINSSSQTGANIIVSINDNITEPVTGAVLNNGAWASLKITSVGNFPKKDSGLMNNGVPLIDLNGADNVTIDGVNSGGNSLTFENSRNSTTAGTSTFRFQNDATNNLITRCTILGSARPDLNVEGGIIIFSGNSALTGNDNNTVSFCDIGIFSAFNIPSRIIHFGGTTTTTALNNSNDTIKNCNIFNFFNSLHSAGVYIVQGSTDIAILNNKIFQTNTRDNGGLQHSSIWINNTSGNNYSIQGNIIGYSSSAGTGVYTLTSSPSPFKFYPIYLSVGTTTPTSVQGNVITNISVSGSLNGTGSSTPFSGIHVTNGTTQIGNITGNTIGSMTDTNSIVYSSGFTPQSNISGISNFGTSTWITNNNNIGGIKALNSAAGSCNIYGIVNTSSSGWTCENNTIGGDVANSIHNATSQASSFINGIANFGGASIITGNTIRNLTSVNGTGSGSSASVIGIMNSSIVVQNISQNNIYSLSNTSTIQPVEVTGISYAGGSDLSNLVARNKIHSLNVVNDAAKIYGINSIDGFVTYQNNMIRLGIDGAGNGVNSGCTIKGINETNGFNKYYFNSVYIGGNPSTGSSNTFALQSTLTSNNRVYQNNIFYNARSNNGSTGKHYSIAVAGSGPNPIGLFCDYNILFANGSGGVTGLYEGTDRNNISSWITATGQDNNSLSSNPQFINPAGNTANVDLHIGSPTPVEQEGLLIGSVTNDFDGQTRSTLTPTDIGADAGNFTSSNIVIVSGASSGNGSHANLANAFAAINSSDQNGSVIILNIVNNTTEPAGGAVLNQGNWISLTIKPSNGNFSVSGAVNPGLPLIDLNGADNVIIDGLNTAADLTTNSLTISNTTVSSVAGTSTIRFQNDATNNLITNCSILGSSTMSVSTDGGTVWFGANSSTIGNDNNTISFCNIGPAGSNLPGTAIYFSGTTASSVLNNNSDTIRNCNIYDYFNSTAHSAGIYVKQGTGDLTFANNKFYQTSLRSLTTANWHCPIWIDNGDNHLISGNTIGFSSGTGTGTYSFSGISGSRFIPIFLAVGTTTATNVQGNSISNLALSGGMKGTGLKSPFAAMFVYSGLVNIGNITGNNIGSMTTTENITYTSTSDSISNIYGIANFGASNWVTNNNSIGGITTYNTGGSSSNIICLRDSSAGTWTAQNNILGGTVQNSIRNTSVASSAAINGILNTLAPSVVTGNVIRNMTAHGGTGFSASGSVLGIVSLPTNNHTISQNEIYNLRNLSNSGTTVATGIFYVGGNGTNLIEKNKIYHLSIASSAGLINGINVQSGTTTFRNNMISLGTTGNGAGVTAGATIRGMIEQGSNSIYHNSIYVGGNPVDSSNNSICLLSSGVFTRTVKNNILYNARSNNGSTGKHYAFYFQVTNASGLTSNYNDLYVSGVNGVLAYFNNTDRPTLASWSGATGQDNNSLSSDPKYISDSNLHIDSSVYSQVNNTGTPVAGITDDFDGNLRSASTPDIGADEFTGTAASTTLNLTMFIEGFYNSGTNLQVSDTIKVFLRNSTSPYAIVDSSASVVLPNGTSSLIFNNASTGTYYIQLKHRNSIETWSASGVLMTQGSTVAYNFSTAASQAFGDNMKQVDASPTRFAIYSGDVNQDGIVDGSDAAVIDNDAFNFAAGYILTDLNGDEVVDGSDAAIADNNVFNFISKITP